MTSTSSPLADRYGAPSRSRRVGLVVAAVAVCAVFLGWLLWAMLFHSNPAVASEEIGHEVVDDHTATIRVQVDADADVSGVSCSMRAISHDKAIVGESTVEPAVGTDRVQEFEIRTERRATTVDWLGCKAPGQPRYR